jgi:hypothetical protein
VDLDFTPSDECVEIKFFSPKEILQQEKIYKNIKKFAEKYTANDLLLYVFFKPGALTFRKLPGFCV